MSTDPRTAANGSERGPQPTPEAVERGVKSIHVLWAKHYVSKNPPDLCDMGTAWVAFAEEVVARQHAREAGLLRALARIRNFYRAGDYGHTIAGDALAAHAALDAAPEPTLLEAAKALLASYEPSFDYKAFCAARESMRAAVERAERAK